VIRPHRLLPAGSGLAPLSGIVEDLLAEHILWRSHKVSTRNVALMKGAAQEDTSVSVRFRLHIA